MALVIKHIKTVNGIGTSLQSYIYLIGISTLLQCKDYKNLFENGVVSFNKYFTIRLSDKRCKNNTSPFRKNLILRLV